MISTKRSTYTHTAQNRKRERERVVAGDVGPDYAARFLFSIKLFIIINRVIISSCFFHFFNSLYSGFGSICFGVRASLIRNPNTKFILCWSVVLQITLRVLYWIDAVCNVYISDRQR